MAGAPRQRQRIASLDGVRGLALVAVLAYHVGPGLFPGGYLGVDMFFVLSGFLLTALLLGEFDGKGVIDRARYAVRRVRRIAPALLVLLAALVVVVPLLAPDDAHRLPGDVVSSLLGVTNWHLIQDGSSYFAQAGRPSFVRHLWSIAIEIQFYVLCPFLVAWLARRRPRVAIGALVAGIAASATLMGLLYESPDPSRAYFGTDTRIHALLVGCLVALVLRQRRRAGVHLSVTRHNTLGLLPLAVVGALVVLGGERSRAMYPAGFLAVEAATAVMIVAAFRPGWLGSLLTGSQLRWLGVRSYGIYLWHWPIAVLVRPGTSADWPAVPAAAAILGGGVLLGALSYRYVERPFLRRRAEPMHRDGRAAAMRIVLLGVTAAVVGTALARIPTTNPLQQVLSAGEHVLATQPIPTTPSTEAPSTTTTAAPAPTPDEPAVAAAPRAPRVRVAAAPVARPAPPPAPALNPPPPGSVPVTAIGDSVMLSAAEELHKRLGPTGYIDAKQNRFFGEAPSIIARLRAQGALGRVLVIHLGNNGPVSPGEVDNAMREAAGVQAVLLVNVRVNRSWQNEVNQTLQDATTRWPTAQLVDWFNFSAGHGDWFQGDGTHFKTSSGPGANGYADLIAGSIPPPPPPPPPPTTTTTTPPPTEPPTTTTTSPAQMPLGR